MFLFVRQVLALPFLPPEHFEETIHYLANNDQLDSWWNLYGVRGSVPHLPMHHELVCVQCLPLLPPRNMSRKLPRQISEKLTINLRFGLDGVSWIHNPTIPIWIWSVFMNRPWFDGFNTFYCIILALYIWFEHKF